MLNTILTFLQDFPIGLINSFEHFTKVNGEWSPHFIYLLETLVTLISIAVVVSMFKSIINTLRRKKT